jgi:hypothetical protein
MDLHSLALEFLAACEEALNTIPSASPGYGGVPASAFISPGSPALDCCEQLAVYVSSISDQPLTGPSPSAPKAKINNVTLVAVATRCIPTSDNDGNPPSEAAQTAAAAQINLDAWALWNHLFNLMDAGMLFDRCGNVVFAGLQVLIPQGGCGGVQVTVRVSLDGYNESFST